MLALLGCEQARVYPASRHLDLTPTTIRFGQVGVGGSAQASIQLYNQSRLPLRLRLTPPPAPFSLRAADGQLPAGLEFGLAPGERRRWQVVFAPTALGEVQAGLQFTEVSPQGAQSGSQPAPRALWARAALAGEGVHRPAPNLEVAPPTLDLGGRAYGVPVEVSLALYNRGDAALTGLKVTTPAGLELAQPAPGALPAGAQAALQLRFLATPMGSYQAQLELSADQLSAPLVVPVKAQVSLSPGYLRCLPASLDFGELQRGERAERELRCLATAGQLTGISFSLAPPFELVSPPSQTALNNGQALSVRVGFAPAQRAGSVHGTLTAQAQGAGPTQRLQIPLHADVLSPARPAIRARLRWDRDASDLDLHLLAPGGQLFQAPGDAYFHNPSPDWGVAGAAVDNPYLDQDNRQGFGPETINLAAAAAGDYQVYVHYYRDLGAGEVQARLQLELDGVSRLDLSRNLTCGTLWHVARLRWDGSAGQLTAVDTLSQRPADSECP